MSEIDLKALAAPFPAEEIEWRVGSTNQEKTKGLALAYITARHVMDRLDEVCTPGLWQNRYEFHGQRTMGYIKIKVGDEWIEKGDGAGDSDVEAEKGAISDALKRAAVPWGVGRYLYDLGTIWVDLVQKGRSYVIADHEKARLIAFLNKSFSSERSVASTPRVAANPILIEGEKTGTGQPPNGGVAPTGAKSTAQRGLYDRLSKANRELKTIAEFNDFWDHKATQAAYWGFPTDWKNTLDAEKRDKEAELSERAKDSVPPEATLDKIAAGQDGYEK